MTAVVDRSLIRPMPLFEQMPDSELDDILAAATTKRYPAGAVVFEQGQVADSYYVLLHGRLRVTQVTPEGQQVIVRIVNPGDIFGIAKAIRRTTYPGTAAAVSESIALGWPMTGWDEMLARHPQLAVNVMRTVGGRLMESHARVRELSTEEVERRVAHTVLRLANQSGVRVADGIRIDFPVTKQDIAEMAGTTLHTVSRILSAWEESSLVEGGRQKLLVKDPHRLVLIAEGQAPGPMASPRAR